MKERRGISPVIATIIIVAVTIAVAIAVAFWMTGIIGLFTGFEQLQITSIYDESDGIYMTVKNTGTQTASVTDVYINGKPCLSLGACQVHDVTGGAENPQVLGKDVQSIVLKPGETRELRVTSLKAEIVGQASPGVSVEVKLLTASGKEYPKLLVLQQYTGGTARFERATIQASSEFDTDTWTVNIKIENTGTTTITIKEILINEKSVAFYSEGEWKPKEEDGSPVCPALDLASLEPISVPPGRPASVKLKLSKGKTCLSVDLNSGDTLNIILKSSTEKEYKSSVTLP